MACRLLLAWGIAWIWAAPVDLLSQTAATAIGNAQLPRPWLNRSALPSPQGWVPSSKPQHSQRLAGTPSRRSPCGHLGPGLPGGGGSYGLRPALSGAEHATPGSPASQRSPDSEGGTRRSSTLLGSSHGLLRARQRSGPLGGASFGITPLHLLCASARALAGPHTNLSALTFIPIQLHFILFPWGGWRDGGAMCRRATEPLHRATQPPLVFVILARSWGHVC